LPHNLKSKLSRSPQFATFSHLLLKPSLRQKKIIISVISDLVTDQRVHRTALTLHEMGYNVLLVGRKLKVSLPLHSTPYNAQRFSLPFEKGVLFYLSYHIRLFCFLLFNKCDLLFANDLDTLLPNYIISKLYRKKLVYDSHEYFTEVPELQNNPVKKRIWQSIERFIFPRLSSTITVNNSIAKLFEEEYGKRPIVIRNLPMPINGNKVNDAQTFKKEKQLPLEKKIIILQGSGINVQRGAEEAVEAMKFLDNVVLLIIGNGDVFEELKKIIAAHQLESKVIIKQKMPYEKLMQFTQVADAGLTLDKNTNLNYLNSLPNKIFDYLQAGIPVIASDLPEVINIVTTHKVGVIIKEVTPELIATAVKDLFSNENNYLQLKSNSKVAAQELCWNNEKQKLENLINTIFAND
jgi:glycosyltransferase involved in cell wall biosynthesis